MLARRLLFQQRATAPVALIARSQSNVFNQVAFASSTTTKRPAAAAAAAVPTATTTRPVPKSPAAAEFRSTKPQQKRRRRTKNPHSFITRYSLFLSMYAAGEIQSDILRNVNSFEEARKRLPFVYYTLPPQQWQALQDEATRLKTNHKDPQVRSYVQEMIAKGAERRKQRQKQGRIDLVERKQQEEIDAERKRKSEAQRRKSEAHKQTKAFGRLFGRSQSGRFGLFSAKQNEKARQGASNVQQPKDEEAAKQ